MSALELRAFLDLLMCSDPWPMDGGRDELSAMADRYSKEHGFSDWIEAYHRLEPKVLP